MSDNDDLESLLNDATQAPNLAATLQKLNDADFAAVVSHVSTEYNKRTPLDPSNLSDAEFRALKARHGV